MALFAHVAGRRDGRRHVIVTSGTDAAYPRAMCDSPIRLADDPLAPACPDCQAKAVAEAAAALDALGLTDLAVRVARVAGDLSFETRKAQTDDGWAPGELSEAYGR